MDNLKEYNDFCHSLSEGSILYNLDFTNRWSQYLLVVNVSRVKINDFKTYTVLMLGLKKENGVFKSKNIRISFTPDYAYMIPFLKYVGRCDYQLAPIISKVNINTGLTAIYGSTNLSKYTESLHIRKPRQKKYDKSGTVIIKKSGN